MSALPALKVSIIVHAGMLSSCSCPVLHAEGLILKSTAASEVVCSKELVSTAPCCRWLQIEPCSMAALASIFVPFHLLAKSWTQDYFFRCQQCPMIIPLLTYNCLVAESLPSQQLWAQRWRHLFTQTEVWERINSRFGKGRGGRGRLILNTSISGPKASKTVQENAPHHPAMLFEMDLSRSHRSSFWTH